MPKIGSAPFSSPSFKPYWTTKDGSLVRLYQGNAVDVLANLPAKSVHCIVTSPPYWGLRDYKVEGQLGAEPSPDCGTQGKAQCGKCFVCNLVAVGRGLRRVLRDDGVFWLNLGDTYSGGKTGRADHGVEDPTVKLVGNSRGAVNVGYAKQRPTTEGIPSGNLVGVPWRVALAFQADGWILRQEVIWQKPSPMPESVKNRCTKSHEQVFMFAKAAGYFYDAEAIKDSAIKGAAGSSLENKRDRSNGNSNGLGKSTLDSVSVEQGSNKRDVWSVPDDTALLNWVGENDPELLRKYLLEVVNRPDVWRISSQGYPGAHFATYPPRLIEPMIRAGTSEKGACAKCGTPWRRVVEEKVLTRERPNDYVKRTGEEGTGNSCANSVAGVETRTIGWEPGCECKEVYCPTCNLSTEVSNVSELRQKHGVYIPENVSTMREEVSRTDQQESMVQPSVRGSMGSEESKNNYRKNNDGEGVHIPISTGAPVGGKRRIHSRASSSDGENSGEVSGGKRDSTPRQREEKRQSTGKPTSNEQVRPRQIVKTPKKEDILGLSMLRKDPSDSHKCTYCGCQTITRSPETQPSVVLDPFIGSGTTCEVSIGLGRRSVGIDLSGDYLKNNAVPRIEGKLLSVPTLARLVPRDAAPPVRSSGVSLLKG